MDKGKVLELCFSLVKCFYVQFVTCIAQDFNKWSKCTIIYKMNSLSEGLDSSVFYGFRCVRRRNIPKWLKCDLHLVLNVLDQLFVNNTDVNALF